MIEFNPIYIVKTIPKLIPYLGVSLFIALVVFCLSLFFGFFLAWVKLGNSFILKKIAYGYTSVIRCTPPLILLFLCYYGLPKIFMIFHIDINSMHQIYFVLIAFTLHHTAELSEVIRSTYESIDPGQFEAAKATGMTNWQSLRRIIIPQGIYIAIPNLGNTVTGLLKDGSVAFTIGVIDVIGRAKLLISFNYGAHALEIYTALAVIYWALSYYIADGAKKLERRVNPQKAIPPRQEPGVL
jgi:L-cystine transport system permease protein